jgi:hypothetical protein
MSTKNLKLTVFLDNIGRIIIGNLVKETSDNIVVENPALVHIQPQANSNQLQLQLLPLFFREFQADRNAPTTWTFKQCNITLADNIEFNPQFVGQYQQTFGAIAPAPQQNPTEVVKLFDDEEEQEEKKK